jgi:two-component SAPR family response regulator
VCAGEQLWPRRNGGEAKPWELLLYLCCQPAEGVFSTTAVEALWPDDNEALDPPHRFRQLRYRLRANFARISGAPSTDGIFIDRGILRLDPAVVYSDAQDFLESARFARIAAGAEALPHLERVRALYVADLLEGPDARRYSWLHEHGESGVTLRQHFRRLYEQASARAAELYAAHGEIEAAVALYRELTELDAGDEGRWRALFRLHAQRSDRLGLVREERRMRAALRELAGEVDDADAGALGSPSRETAQEYQRLLASIGDLEREAAAV